MNKILLALLLLPAGVASAAFPDGWEFKQSITVPAASIDSDLTDFTVLVTRGMLHDDVVTTAGSDQSQADGGDVRFSSDAAGTEQLPCDVINWSRDSSPGADDATILVSVKVPSLTALDGGTFYIWYNTAGSDSQPVVGDTYGQYAAYDNGWHSFLPDGGYTLTNRTSAINSYTSHGTPTLKTGPKDGIGATEYLTVSSYVDVTNLPTRAFTFICWANPPENTTEHWIFCLADESVADHYYSTALWTDGRTLVIARDGASATNQQAAIPDNYIVGWHQQAGVFISAISTKGYMNDTEGVDTDPPVTPADTDILVWGAKRNAASKQGNVQLSLCEVHDVERVPGWINAHYDMINAPATFGAPGTPEETGGSAVIFGLHEIETGVPGTGIQPIETGVGR